MLVKTKSKDLLDYLIFLILLFDITILKWLDLNGIASAVLLILLILSIVINFKQYCKDKTVWLLLIPLYMFVNKRRTSGDYITLFNNLRIILLPTLLLLYYSEILRHKKEFIKQIYNKSFLLFNFFILLNIFVLLLQMSGNYSLNGFEANTNVYKPDLMSGLFGANGVPNLTLYSAFIIIYNYYIGNSFSRKSFNRKCILIYDFLLAIFFLVFSIFNDNKFFYVILLEYLIIFYIANLEARADRKPRRDRWKFILRMVMTYILFMSIIVVLLYRHTPMQYAVDAMLHDISIGIEKTNLVQGSNERLGMISFILQDKEHRLFGYGLGYTSWTTPNTFGFVHYGQSDLGTFMCLGGILFAIVIILYIFFCLKLFVNNIFPLILLLLNMILLSIYTQIFTVTVLMGCSILFVSLCGILIDPTIKPRETRGERNKQ